MLWLELGAILVMGYGAGLPYVIPMIALYSYCIVVAVVFNRGWDQDDSEDQYCLYGDL